MAFREWTLAAAALLALTAPARATDDCHLYKIATVDMQSDTDGVFVPITISGRKLRMEIDTGGIYSMLTPATRTTPRTTMSA